MKRYVIVLLLAMLSFSAFAQRKALVIGNSDYGKHEFKSSLNDAQLAADALKALDYEVTQKSELEYADFISEIDRFKKNLNTGDVAVFYFSGFTKQQCDKNYLMPIPTKMDKEEHLISVDVVLEALSRATDSFMFLESRQIPQSFFKNPCGKNKGLAPVIRLAANQGFAMAASVDEQLKANDAKYSVFTHALFKNMTSEMMDFPDLMSATVQDVKTQTNNDQLPYWKSNRKAPFSFYHPEQPLKFRFRLPSYNSLEGGGSYNF